jgi:hypothetical protein
VPVKFTGVKSSVPSSVVVDKCTPEAMNGLNPQNKQMIVKQLGFLSVSFFSHVKLIGTRQFFKVKEVATKSWQPPIV